MQNTLVRSMSSQQTSRARKPHVAGEEEFSKLSQDYKGFRLIFADSLLAKEKLDAALK